MKKNYYFAYGSNSNLEHLIEYSKKINLRIDRKDITTVSRAYIPDRSLGFTRMSANWKGGVLDIVPKVGSVVEGVIFEVTPQVKEILDKKEGVKQNCYRRIELRAILPDGSLKEVFTYEVIPEIRESFIAPSENYLEVVKAGYEKNDISPSALLSAASGSKESYLVDAVFVYGTLMRGEVLHRHTVTKDLQCIIMAEAPGTLWNLGLFPLAKVGSNESGWIKGEFIRYKKGTCPLIELDRVEGIDTFTGKSSGITRSLIEVGTCDGRLRLAWIYILEGGAKEKIYSNDWRVHSGTKESFINKLISAHVEGIKISKNQFNNFDNDIGQMSLETALLIGLLSERRLAQRTGKWKALAGYYEGPKH